jgi:uncharacterized protein (UPF0332 family)
MSLTEHDRATLISHRIERAKETAGDAHLLYENNKYLSAVNRIYYAMHHALYALALKNNYITGKHGQLIGWFNKTYVKTGLIDAKYSRIITRAFEKRMDSDYDNYTVFSSEEVETMLRECGELINAVESLLE